MAETDRPIDTLQLKIESNAQKAAEQLDKLSTSLSGLNRAVGSGQSGLQKLSSELGSLSTSLKGFSKVKIPDFSKFNIQGDFTGLSTISKGMQEFAKSAQTVSAIKTSDITKSIRAVEKIGSADLSGIVNSSKAIQGVDFSSISNLSKSLGDFSLAVQSLSSSKTADINKTIRSIERLGSVDFSGITNGIRSMQGIDFSMISDLGNAVNGFIQSISGAENVSSGIARIFTSLSQLASQSSNILTLQSTLPGLSTVVRGFVETISLAPIVDAGTVSLVTALSGITSSGARAVKAAASINDITDGVSRFIEVLSKAPKLNDNIIKAVQSLSQLANAGGKAGSAARSLQGNINSLSNSMKGFRSSILKPISGIKSLAKQLLYAAGVAGGFYAAINGIKKSIDIASDLTEVQNVVDITFGDMKQKVEDMANISIGDFGMSELTVKKIASRYQAMGSAMGFSTEKMSDMSIELTKLAADMASFYNVSQESVAEDLESIFTGQTRPLRQYGLDLTEATVGEWALRNGIEANFKSMSQQEKMLLRYQYVLANTGAAQGDFARTADSWHNTIVRLVQSFQQLGKIVGTSFINAFRPLVSTLNNVMAKVIEFAETVSNALGAIFGWKIEINSGGLLQDADAAEDLATGMGDAAAGADDLKKKLSVLPFDQLNQLSSDMSKAGSGTGGGLGGSGIGDGAEAGLVKTETIFDKYKSDIDTLYELGEYINKVLTDVMNGINWNAIYEKARNFGKGLADFLNGLISPDLFGAVGRTIAGALNTAIYAALSFGENFDWEDLGNSIAEGINEFFRTFDFKALAKSINKWAKGLLDTIIKAINKVDWDQIGKKIGDFLVGIDFFSILGKVGLAIWKAINAGLKTYASVLDAAPIETAFLTLFGASKFLKSDIFGTFVSQIEKSITKIKNLFKILTDVFTAVKVGFSNGGFLAGISGGLDVIRGNLTKVQKGAVVAVSALLEFSTVRSAFSDIVTGTGSLIANIAEIGVAAGAAGLAFSAVFAPPVGIIIAGITAAIGGIVGMNDAINEMANNSAIGKFSDAIDEVAENLSKRTDDIRNRLENLSENFENAGVVESEVARDLAGEYEKLSSKTKLTADEQSRLREVSSKLAEIVPGVSGYIDEQTGYLTIQKEELYHLIDAMDLYAKKQAAFEALTEAYKINLDAQNNLTKAQNEYKAGAEELIVQNGNLSDSVKDMIRNGDIQGLRNLYDDLWKTAMSSSKDYRQQLIAVGDALEENFGTRSQDTVKKMLDDLDKSLSGLNDQVIDANDALAESNEQIEFARNAYYDASSAIDKYSEAEIEAKKASVEYKQALIDIGDSLKNVDLNVSDKLVEDLAMMSLEDTGAVDKIIGFFQQMEDQTELSTEDLTDLFGLIAPAVSSEFISALSNEDAKMQAQVAMTLANIASGAEVSSEELKNVFSVIGMELPDELITQMSLKGDDVSNSALGLMAKLEEGGRLASENLKLVFDALGIIAPTELIETLSKYSADTQSAAIELLANLQYGGQASEGDVKSFFRELGYSIPDETIHAMESKKSDVISTTKGLYDDTTKEIQTSGGTAKTESRNTGENVGKEYAEGIKQNQPLSTKAINEMMQENKLSMEDGGKNLILGLLLGLGSNELLQQVYKSGTLLGKTAEEGERDYTATESPSGLFKELGGYLVEGLNEGISEKSDTTKSYVETWMSKLVSVVSSKVPNIKKLMSDAWSELNKETDRIWLNLKTSVSKALEEMKSKTQSLTLQIKQKILDEWNNVLSKTKDTWTNISNSLSEKMNLMRSNAQTFGQNILSVIQSAWSNIQSNSSGTWSSIRGSLTGIWGSLSSSASGIFNGIASAISSAFSSVKGTISGMQSSFSGAVSAAQSAASSVVSIFNNIHIPDIPLPHFSVSSSTHTIGNVSFSLPSVSVDWYKVGGLFQDAHVIGVGESGAEAVLPLESSKAMSKIADSILSNAPDAGYRAEDLRDAVAQGVALAMMNNQGNNSAPEYIQNSIYLDGDVIARSVSKAQRDTDRRYNPTPRYGY